MGYFPATTEPKRAEKIERPKTVQDELTEHALRVAALNHHLLLTRIHLLIAIAQNPKSPGGSVLNELGATAEKLTGAALITIWVRLNLRGYRKITTDEKVGTSLRFAEKIASVLGQNLTDAHILLAFLSASGSLEICTVLQKAKVDYREVIRKTAEKIGASHQDLERAVSEARSLLRTSKK